MLIGGNFVSRIDELDPANSDDETRPEIPTTGLSWALSMLGLDLIEWLVLFHIIYFDHPDPERISSAIWFLFVISSSCMILQLAGVALVALGYYRLGGVVQIASSVPHLIKLEGAIGIIGGQKAYRYGEYLMGKNSQSPISTL